MNAARLIAALLALVPALALIDCSTSNSECKFGLCYQTSPHATESISKPTKYCLNPEDDDRTLPKPPTDLEGVTTATKDIGNNKKKMADVNNYKQELMATCSGDLYVTIGNSSAQVNFFDPNTMFCKQETCEAYTKDNQTAHKLTGAGTGKYRFAGGVEWATKLQGLENCTLNIADNGTTTPISGTKYTAKEVCQSGKEYPAATTGKKGKCMYPYGTEVDDNDDSKPSKSDCASGETYDNNTKCGCKVYTDCVGPKATLMQGEIRFDCNTGGEVTADGDDYDQYQCVPRKINVYAEGDVELLKLTLKNPSGTLTPELDGLTANANAGATRRAIPAIHQMRR